MNTERILSSDEIESYASQAARFQDVIEDMNFPVEGEISMPRFLFGALGPKNARLVTERMVQIRKSPSERDIATQVECRVLGSS